ncbi:MAG: 50S ribosomal protein L6 [Candidatus Woykebacteria bacterium RBG_13_40_15]|uniref:Large ribosomal subunit protein uL6 n=1 Tax=Candidatus Woykebacteria bacterium RBG_13_40_15 TaxID=1802593 RepID=A0A1G1W936_9BACT|nr:MAG: 50S ribosomal protein L6 [Candidatus Woykebacteria bacterium RBG_13_40_15]
MSRIGRKPISIPETVNVEINHKVLVKGPLGELNQKIPRGIKVEQNDNMLVVSAQKEDKQTKAFHGLIRKLIANMIEGVTVGFKKRLELIGIGYRANLSGDKLVLSLGFSHPVEIKPVEGIDFSVSDNKITVSGINKELVGRIAAEIRTTRPPDAYKGKGIRYEGEIVKLKPGKAAKTSVGSVAEA